MATIRPDYYVLWNTDNEGEKYYIAQKTRETSKYIYVKYDVAGNETSYFKKDDVNKSKSKSELYNVLTSEQWAAYILEDMRQAYYNPPLGAVQVADQPQEGSGRKRRKKKTRKMKGGHHLYKRLGVSKYASQKQIKKAYNKLKKKKKLTKKVKHAYKILSKKKTRKQYNNRYRKVMKHKRHTRKKRGGNDVWDLKKEYENIINKYKHDMFWIDNAHKGQKAARKFKNVGRRLVGKKKVTTEAQAKAERNTKLEALKEKAWKSCKPDKEKLKKIKENVEVALSGKGNLTLELKNGKFVDIDPKNIHPAHVKGGPGFDWNVWTAKLMNEFEREQDRLEAEMNKSGLYGVCDIYDEIEKKLREDEDKENKHEANKQRELNKNLRKMGLQGY